MPKPIEPTAELEQLLTSRRMNLNAAIASVASAAFSGRGLASAEANLARTLSETQALADLFGRRRVLLHADHMRRKFATTAEPSAADILPGVPFIDAVEQIAKRRPSIVADVVAAAGGNITPAEAMLEIYSANGFSLARAATREVVETVQKAIAENVELGLTRASGEKAVMEAVGDVNRAYAGTVYRNAVTTSYSAGTFQQLRDPDVSEVIGALRFDAIIDGRETSICRQFDDTIATPGDPIWEQRTPPCHHGCRSSLAFVDRFLLDDGLQKFQIPNPGAKPDAGFGGRTDIAIYGVRR